MSADLIARFGREVIVNSPAAAGTYVDGMWVDPGVTSQTIIASVQPLTAKELLLLPDADRQRERLKLYSTYEFQVQKDGAQTDSDIVVIDRKSYMVTAVTDFIVNQAMNLKYYRADVVSVNPDPS